MKKTCLWINLAIYTGLVSGALLGRCWPNRVWQALIPATQTALQDLELSPGTLAVLVWLGRWWPLLGLVILLTNAILIGLSILAGTLWRALLLPLGAIFAFNLGWVSAAYVAINPLAFLLLLPILLLEGQAVIIGLTIALDMGGKPGSYRQRLSTLSHYQRSLRWVLPLLIASGLWEARVLHSLITFSSP